MTKRPHASLDSPYAEPLGRQTSYDGDGSGSHEDGDASLKKPRSFMATLVCDVCVYVFMKLSDLGRPATSVDHENRDVMKTDQSAATAGPITWCVPTKHQGRRRKTSPWLSLLTPFEIGVQD
jgi:hypothetical protein